MNTLSITGTVTLVEFLGNEVEFKSLQKIAKTYGGAYVPNVRGVHGNGFAFRSREKAESFLTEAKKEGLNQ
jgi:hypothetical protein